MKLKKQSSDRITIDGLYNSCVLRSLISAVKYDFWIQLLPTDRHSSIYDFQFSTLGFDGLHTCDQVQYLRIWSPERLLVCEFEIL